MPAGRPSDFNPLYVEQVYKLALLGLTDEEMANVFDVHVATLHRWGEKHPEFRDARARGKSLADAEVSERLYRRALGYSHEAVKILQSNGEALVVPYTEHYPPDTQAATWWLKNRQSAHWKERVEHTGADGAPMQLEITHNAKALTEVFGEVIENEPLEAPAIEPPMGDAVGDSLKRRARKDSRNNKLRSKLDG